MQNTEKTIAQKYFGIGPGIWEMMKELERIAEERLYTSNELNNFVFEDIEQDIDMLEEIRREKLEDMEEELSWQDIYKRENPKKVYKNNEV